MKLRTLFSCILLLNIATLLGQSKIDSLFLLSNRVRGEDKAEILYKIAGEIRSDHPDSALSYLFKAESIIGDNKNSLILPYIYIRSGEIYKSQNEFDRAINYSTLAFELFKTQNSFEQIGDAGLTIGNIYFGLGDYIRAYSYYMESIDAYKRVGNSSRIAHLMSNLGTIAHETGDLEDAELKYKESIRLYIQSNEIDKTKKVINNIGMLFYDRQEYDSALAYLQKVLELADEETTYDKYLISSASNNIALIYYDLGEYELGLNYLHTSLSKSLEIASIYNVVSAYVNLGSFHTELGHFDSTAHYLDKGLAISYSLGYQTLKYDLLHEKSLMYAAMHRYEEAYYWSCKADTLEDLIFNEDMGEKIANLRVGYELDFKRVDIERLKNEKYSHIKLTYAYLVSIIVTLILIVIITINLRTKRSTNIQLSDKNRQLTETIQLLKESEEQLKNLNKSKDMIFSIVAHDLRNPAAAVSGFTELLSDNFDQLTIETQKEYLLQILLGTQRMQNLLENLLIWSRSQMKAVSCEPKAVIVADLIEDTIKQVLANLNHKKVTHQIEVDPELIAFADYPMIATVLRNIFMNAIKFSFPGGKIEISAKLEEDHCLITIKDEGIGIQQEIQEKLFISDSYISTPGTSGESGSGLGLKISTEFMEKNNGTIGVKSEPGKGSTFYITLPTPT